MHVDRPAHRLGIDRVLVAIEADEAGLGHRGHRRPETVEGTAVRDQDGTLGFEHVEHRLVLLLGMRSRLGVRHATVKQKGVELGVALELQPRREEALPHHADLVLDLALLPARRRRAGSWLHQMVAAHPQEAAIVGALLAHEDAVDGRLHVVVDADLGRALEEGERPVMGVEHHLLGLARIGPHERHAAVAKPDVRNLDDRGHTREHHNLMAPVELIGFAGSVNEWHIGLGKLGVSRTLPAPAIATNRVVAALEPEPAQLLPDAHQRQPLTAWSALVLLQ